MIREKATYYNIKSYLKSSVITNKILDSPFNFSGEIDSVMKVKELQYILPTKFEQIVWRIKILESDYKSLLFRKGTRKFWRIQPFKWISC